VRTKTVKRSARAIVERYYQKLALDFHNNKRVRASPGCVRARAPRRRRRAAGGARGLRRTGSLLTRAAGHGRRGVDALEVHAQQDCGLRDGTALPAAALCARPPWPPHRGRARLVRLLARARST
jgi:hypothetical protein